MFRRFLRITSQNTSEQQNPVNGIRHDYAVAFYLPSLLGLTPIAAATIGGGSEPTSDGVWGVAPHVGPGILLSSFPAWLVSVTVIERMLAGSITESDDRLDDGSLKVAPSYACSTLYIGTLTFWRFCSGTR